MEKFAGLDVCGFNPIEIFAEILSRFLGKKCLLFSVIKERCLCSWKNFHGTLEDHGKIESLTQHIFPHLWYASVSSHTDSVIYVQ